MTETFVSAKNSALIPARRRQRMIGILMLLVLGLYLLYKYLRGQRDNDGSLRDRASSSTPRLKTVAGDNELTLRDRDAAAVRAAAEKYSKVYQRLMQQLLAPKDEEEAPPFIGFSLADNIRDGALVVDGVYVKGPAFEVGVDIDHELVSIEGESATTVETVRALVAKHCKPGRVTNFTFFDDNNNRGYDAEVWVMTADERFRGKPYFFARTEHQVRQSDRLKQTWRPGQSPDKSTRK